MDNFSVFWKIFKQCAEMQYTRTTGRSVVELVHKSIILGHIISRKEIEVDKEKYNKFQNLTGQEIPIFLGHE